MTPIPIICLALASAAALASAGALSCLLQRRRAKWATAGMAVPALPPPPRSPSVRTAHVYVAGCDGLQALRRRAGGVCSWKIGAVQANSRDLDFVLTRRLEALGRCAYAGFTKQGTRMSEEPGFRAWRLQRLAQPVAAARRRDLTFQPDAITVRLPPELSFAQFEARFRKALDPFSWQNRSRARRSGAGRRYSLREDGHAVATELFTLSPRRSSDVQALVDAIIAVLDATG